ncbi:hypothetical protein GLOIN_2v1619393 [Rhizophagus irregularis DAOM 181602=DAOM 197198]|uniref:Uncharacterized protein n=1 Tax=Rhizophagus irregularis (strain DAOM 181602 / DAOM 197198 / MUCL 43194) TaxID=747089 RepID=A0A2P4PXH0_RHIID|nr:hypothetical protein GLOIN_2v1619393 [Rhizophagus irregularis DAOM 181602=DAOM 197198]POG70097.1 hypothetical protein GLOIN_2v1619393 [Rhizophagus irregularis DAOM 181602=DAOM 197198]|eukprot:XP_025176963.1 hypothetical protein GLOIN_2v1619393 [Rhizophagus irregularis DAOM 181602=DAOM 197198]
MAVSLFFIPFLIFRSFRFFHSPFVPFRFSLTFPSFLLFPFTLPVFFHSPSFFLINFSEVFSKKL